MGAILFVPVEDYMWKDVKPENWNHLPIDTIYIQGIEPEMHTSVLIDEFMRYGPKFAIVRDIRHEEVERRKYMFIQYEHWASAWHAVKGSHGNMLKYQDIDVEISNRTLEKVKGRENMFVWDELYDEWLY